MGGLVRKGAFLAFVAVMLSLLYVPHESWAMKNIPDGGAMFTGEAQESKNVDKTVKKKWLNKQITRGGRNPGSYPATSGKKLIYDVYKGGSSNAKKRPFTVTPTGNYLTLDGWSVLMNYHHHAKKNQATYIGLVNKAEGSDRLIYKAAMRSNTSQTTELKYEGNPTCSDNKFNVDNTKSGGCNMKYNYTQFRAYLDLREIFEGENENKEWEVYIIKRIDDNLVYDELKIPYEVKKEKWGKGQVTLSGGIDSSKLEMVGDAVIKRSGPGKSYSGPSGAQRYFAKGRTYKSNKVDDGGSSSVSMWYRVLDNVTAGSHKATNKNKWASSAYWESRGDVATLRYEETMKTCPDGSRVSIDDDCEVDVTIKHAVEGTGEELDVEHKKATVGKKYSFSSKPKGHFKDDEGKAYAPYPTAQTKKGETPNHTVNITFYYKVIVGNPEKECEIGDEECPDEEEPMPEPEGDGGSGNGASKGGAYWELQRTDENDPSEVFAEVSFKPAGEHYAIRNIEHSLKMKGYSLIKQEKPISAYFDAGVVKDGTMDYTFSYEYTNHYKHHYKCVDRQDGECFDWRYTHTTPVWSKGRTFTEKDSLKTNHRQEDTITTQHIEDALDERLLVGRSDSYNGGSGKKENFYEALTKKSEYMKSNNQLKTQTFLTARPSDLQYKVSTPSGSQKDSAFQPLKKGWIHGRYYPKDVDDSLKESLTNVSGDNKGDYAFFLQQSEMKDRSMEGNERVFDMRFVSDYFFVSENTGFMIDYPYAYELYRHYKYDEQKPSNDAVATFMNDYMGDQYKNFTGQKFDEKIIGLDGNTVSDEEKLQRYYLPISPKSILEPNKTYHNPVVLENIGLNDVKWEYNQTFVFEHYLFGSAHDDAWIVEQREGKVEDFDPSDVRTITIKDEDKEALIELIENRPSKRLHEFRVTDRATFIDKIKEIVGEF